MEKYGKMYVPEDPSKPVKAAEFWKDPNDNRVYVRYQTKDGTWSAPRRQASDIDTMTHSGGEKLTYEQSRDLQYKQAMGQLGEGDTPTWLTTMLKTGDAGDALKDPTSKPMFMKALDALSKANGKPVVEQSLNGYVLKTVKIPEFERGVKVAEEMAKAKQWTPSELAKLRSLGVLK